MWVFGGLSDDQIRLDRRGDNDEYWTRSMPSFSGEDFRSSWNLMLQLYIRAAYQSKRWQVFLRTFLPLNYWKTTTFSLFSRLEKVERADIVCLFRSRFPCPFCTWRMRVVPVFGSPASPVLVFRFSSRHDFRSGTSSLDMHLVHRGKDRPDLIAYRKEGEGDTGVEIHVWHSAMAFHLSVVQKICKSYVLLM